MIVLLALLFPPIDEKIPEGPFSYPGKFCTREEITVDPSSPVLSEAYRCLENQLDTDHSEEEILLITFLYIRETLFDLSLCSEKNLMPLLFHMPIVPLDLFLQEKMGVCRHIALTTTYLIDKLIQNKWLQGEVYLIREDLYEKRHAWTLFLSENSAWHLDPFWEVLEDGKTAKGFHRLCGIYSPRTMEKQRIRWAKS